LQHIFYLFFKQNAKILKKSYAVVGYAYTVGLPYSVGDDALGVP